MSQLKSNDLKSIVASSCTLSIAFGFMEVADVLMVLGNWLWSTGVCLVNTCHVFSNIKLEGVVCLLVHGLFLIMKRSESLPLRVPVDN